MRSEVITAILAQLRQGRMALAERMAVEQLRVDPQDAGAWSLAGVVARQTENHAVSLARLRRALSLAPGHAESHSAMGLARAAAGSPDAPSSIRRALALKPADPRLLLALAAVTQRSEPSGAVRALTDYLRQRPSEPQPWAVLSSLRAELGDEAAGRLCAQRAIALDPANPNGYVALHQAAGRSRNGARGPLDRSLALAPRHLAALWLLLLELAAAVPASCDALEASRRRYAEILGRVEEASANGGAETACTLGWPWQLPYQGFDDRALQTRLGNAAHRLMTRRFPRWSAPPPMPPVEGRIRVGIVSAYFYRHSNWKIPIRGWAKGLDRGRFELFAYHAGSKEDAATDEARTLFDHFAAETAVERLAARIASDRLHVLIVPEIGLSATVAQLAALWLAPVQCASWGHPETSGLPTIGYFLSSDLMEPADGQDHYTETLVRLPGLSIAYEPEAALPMPPDPRALGMRRDAIRFWCCQDVRKYLPRHDALLARIARSVSDPQFMVLADLNRREGQILKVRLTDAFARAGVDPERALSFVPPLSYNEFLGMADLTDVFLDTPSWSGCNTTLEMLGQGLPAVTFEGGLMRARHGAAILRAMGLPELIARTDEEYVAIAVRLAEDRRWRMAMAGEVRRRVVRLYGDRSGTGALSSFIEARVASGLAEGGRAPRG